MKGYRQKANAGKTIMKGSPAEGKCRKNKYQGVTGRRQVQEEQV